MKEVVEVACNKEEALKKELTNLAWLFRNSARHWCMKELVTPEKRKFIEEYGQQQQMVPNAAIYVLWYTQLCELVKEHPHLATRLRVTSLPGKGVRGDWYLGVTKGSVSASLGIQIIKILCSEEEEYKRFVRGVGFPVRDKYYDKGSPFVAWPRADTNIKLWNIIDMHRKANVRSKIGGYDKVRTALGELATQLIYVEEEDEHAKFADDLIRRLGNIVKFLCPSVVSH